MRSLKGIAMAGMVERKGLRRRLRNVSGVRKERKRIAKSRSTARGAGVAREFRDDTDYTRGRQEHHVGIVVVKAGSTRSSEG